MKVGLECDVTSSQIRVDNVVHTVFINCTTKLYIATIFGNPVAIKPYLEAWWLIHMIQFKW